MSRDDKNAKPFLNLGSDPSPAELREILDDISMAWTNLGDVAMQIPDAREVVAARRELPAIVEHVFGMAARAAQPLTPSKQAQILAAKIVTKRGEFADMATASTAALLLATEILQLAYPNGVPTDGAGAKHG